MKFSDISPPLSEYAQRAVDKVKKLYLEKEAEHVLVPSSVPILEASILASNVPLCEIPQKG